MSGGLAESGNKICFASDDYLSLGGLEVFATKIQDNNFNAKVMNVG
jgi:hypothetical protein